MQAGPQALLEDLGRNIALVLGLMFAFGFLRAFVAEGRPRLRSLLSGLLFGVASVASLAAPVRLAPGVFMDMRNVLVALAVVFEGPVAGLMAGALALGYRVSVAGPGLLPGALLILAAIGIGSWFHAKRGGSAAPSSRVLLAMGSCISVAALALTFLLALEMPFAAVQALLERVSLAVVLGYPIGTWLMGTLLSYETRRLDAERTLRHERDLLQRVSATSPASIIVLDRTGHIVMANAQAEKVLGIENTTLLQRGYNAPEWMITDFDGRPISDQDLPFRLVREQKAPVLGTRVAIDVAGKRVFLSVNGAPMFDEQDEITGVVLALEDVTDRLEAERRLHESEEKFRTLFNRTSEAVFVQPLEDEGPATFLEVNDLACSWLEAPREELLQLSFADIDSSHTADGIATLFRAARGRPVTFDAQLRGRQGKEHAVEVVAHSVMLMGQPVIMALARDLSERRILEAQVRQSQKMEVVGRLAGGIAHDFNNVLSIILLSIESLERDPDARSTRALVQEVRHAAERGSALTKQLLAFSRKQVIVPRTLMFSEALDSMLQLFRRLIPTGVELKSRFADDGACVHMDLGQLEQVVLNLIVNARDAVGDKGRIEIEAHRTTRPGASAPGSTLSGEYVVLEVRDTGSGMSEEVIARIFEPFFTTKQDHGTGLGLSICYGIVRDAGGTIEVVSSPGQGAIFRVYLPITSAAELPTRVTSLAPPRGTERILLVDDEPSLRSMVHGLLVESGYDVVDFASAELALAYAQQDAHADLLLTDIAMPRTTGPELAGTLRRKWPALRVVYMSGYAADAIERYKLQTDDLHLIQKPFSTDQLAATVRHALDQRPRVRERFY